MGDQIKLQSRETRLLDLNTIRLDQDLGEPETWVLQVDKNQHDLGKLCYRIRSNCVSKRSRKSSFVALESIDQSRRKFLKNFLGMIVAGEVPYSIITQTKNFFYFIDCEFKSVVDFNDPKSLRVAYAEYMSKLRQQMSFSRMNEKAGSVSSAYAYRYQHTAICVLKACFPDLSREIPLWEPKINQRTHRTQKPPKNSEDNIAKMQAVHLTIFEQLARFLLDKSPFPAKVEFNKKLGFPPRVWFSKVVNSENNFGFKPNSGLDWIQLAYDGGSLFQGDWSELRELGLLRGVDIGIRSKAQRSPIKKKQVGLEKSNADRSVNDFNRRIIANYAIYHFCYCLLGDTGCNLSMLEHIDFSSLRKMHAVGKTRLISVKNRGGNRKQPIEFSARFEKYWNLFIELMNWCTSGTADSLIGIHAFSCTSEIKFQKYDPTSLSEKARSPFVSNDMPWVNASELRKNVSLIYLEETGGDLEYVANKILFNNLETARKHYTERRFVDSIQELGTFFDKMRASAILRVQSNATVKIVEIDAPQTSTGRCIAETTDTPTLDDQFKSSVLNPRCGAPITCIFCTYFAIHSDVNDLKKLMSLKIWVEHQSKFFSKNIDEHFLKFAPLITRIDELLDEVKKKSPAVFLDAQREINNGKLDSFWSYKIDALIEAEYSHASN